MNEENPHAILFFDGVCNLCNESVDFIIRHDKKGYFKFASLQSDFAKQQLTTIGQYQDNIHTVVLLENGKVYTHSSVSFQVVKHLDGLYPILYAFAIIPVFLRDKIYNWIASNRYKWFGKLDTCRIPTEEEKGRFIA